METGAWRVAGRAVPGDPDFFFTFMQDSNEGKRGSLLVLLDNYDGREMSLSVRAFGSDERFTETFEGREWEQASTARRASLARAALLRAARSAAGRCGALLSSLDDELASFDLAFAAFDQRAP
jgi:hypothetical protein